MSRNAEMSVIDVFKIIWPYRFLILAVSIIATGAAFAKVAYFTVPIYEANAVLCVSNRGDVLFDEESVISQSDLDSAKRLTTTYMEVLKTRSFLTEISNLVDNEYTWQEIKNMLSIKTVNSTELLAISVQSANADDAYKIVKIISQRAPDKLTTVFKGGEVAVVDEAVRPQLPIDNELAENAVLGFIVGIVLSIGIVFIRFIFDKKVHRGEDVSARYNISILGEISQ